MYDVSNNTNNVGFISRVSDMYWLDGGHNGGSNTWVTDDLILGKFDRVFRDRLKVHVGLHVTPFQVEDKRRPWVGVEQRQFVAKLQKLGIKIFLKNF